MSGLIAALGNFGSSIARNGAAITNTVNSVAGSYSTIDALRRYGSTDPATIRAKQQSEARTANLKSELRERRMLAEAAASERRIASREEADLRALIREEERDERRQIANERKQDVQSAAIERVVQNLTNSPGMTYSYSETDSQASSLIVPIVVGALLLA